jgi:hypothetical protein
VARPGRRALAYAVVVAVVLGALLGWFARAWTTASPGARARDRLGEIRERVRELTH